MKDFFKLTPIIFVHLLVCQMIISLIFKWTCISTSPMYVHMYALPVIQLSA